MPEFTRVCADIDLSAIRQNVINLMKDKPEGTGALSVIKANAYGHGDVAVARAVDDLTEYFAVATLPEAHNLRKTA